MKNSPVSQLLNYSQQAEELALLLSEKVATMTANELEKNSEQHLFLQEKIISLSKEIQNRAVYPEETEQLDKARKILARLIEYNKKITLSARNSQALLKNNMRSMGESRVALSGYSQAQMKSQKRGSLINNSR